MRGPRRRTAGGARGPGAELRTAGPRVVGLDRGPRVAVVAATHDGGSGVDGGRWPPGGDGDGARPRPLPRARRTAVSRPARGPDLERGARAVAARVQLGAVHAARPAGRLTTASSP